MTEANRAVRPNGLRKTLFKHMKSEARDCPIEWLADFGKMEILMYAPFISPALLIDCLFHMARQDERFQKANITGLLQISHRFDIKLCVEHGDSAVWYQLRVYTLCTGSEKLDRLEIELTGIPQLMA